MARKTCSSLVVKSMDFLLLPFFLLFSIAIPLFDSQTIFPPEWFDCLPKVVELKSWYAKELGDYLVYEKPYFYVGLVWLEVVVFWPLCLACLWAIVAKKPWFRIACLVAGVQACTSLGAVIGEVLGSGRGSRKMYEIHAPFVFFSIVATLRGLIPSTPFASVATSASTTTGNNIPSKRVVKKKKKATETPNKKAI